MKKNIFSDSPRTMLKISHEEFKSKLIEQISNGKMIYSTDIQTEGQLLTNEKEYNLWNDYNTEYLKSVFTIAENKYRQRYSSTGSMIGVREVLAGVNTSDPIYRRRRFRQLIEAKIEDMESLLLKADLIPSEIENSSSMKKEPISISHRPSVVFIIHGHDEEMKKSVQVFLSRGDLQDIVLHEQPDKNLTVIEKLIQEGAAADYVIGLLSPDDVQEDGSVRARQNVILEIGYFIGKLGRDKVRLLRRGNTAIPSDLQGILFENYDEAGAWRIKLAKEIQAVGVPINIDKIISKF